jgi:hypothetical protein
VRTLAQGFREIDSGGLGSGLRSVLEASPITQRLVLHPLYLSQVPVTTAKLGVTLVILLGCSSYCKLY